MIGIRRLLVLASAAVLSASCMHRGQYESGGEVMIDPATAANTTLLRVTNPRDMEMKMFAVYDGQEHYLGSVLAKRTRTFALDPSLLTMSRVTFTARAIDNSDAVNRGPFPLSQGATVDFTIPKHDLDTAPVKKVLPPEL